MFAAFVIAKGKVAILFPNYEIEYENRNTSQIVTAGTTAEDHVRWLTEKDGCIILTHMFESDFPVLWDYCAFIRLLSETAKQKSIPIYPKPQQITDDAAFTQVILFSKQGTSFFN